MRFGSGFVVVRDDVRPETLQTQGRHGRTALAAAEGVTRSIESGSSQGRSDAALVLYA
jgi:hypothetical protein